MSVQSLVKRLMGVPLRELDAEIAAVEKEKAATIARLDARIALLKQIRAAMEPGQNGHGRGANGASVADPTTAGLSITDQVRQYVETHGPAEIPAIAEATGLDTAQVRPVLCRLKGVEFLQTANGQWKSKR